jgi:hypothetical protein
MGAHRLAGPTARSAIANLGLSPVVSPNWSFKTAAGGGFIAHISDINRLSALEQAEFLARATAWLRLGAPSFR